VCGVRANGYWSFYLDPERVYQFDDHFRLRRAFVDGDLFRSQGRTLARMHRERSDSETALLRSDLAAFELTEYLSEMRRRLAELRDHLASGKVRILDVIPAEADVLAEVRAALESILDVPLVLAPAFKGKA
jgi:hypothetical protein